MSGGERGGRVAVVGVAGGTAEPPAPPSPVEPRRAPSRQTFSNEVGGVTVDLIPKSRSHRTGSGSGLRLTSAEVRAPGEAVETETMTVLRPNMFTTVGSIG